MGKLKIRLFIAFISIIVLPIAVTALALAVQSSHLEQQDQTVSDSYEKMEKWLREEISREDGLSQINLKEAVERFSTDIKIMNRQGDVLFQSSSHISSDSNTAVSLPPSEFDILSTDGQLYNVEMRSHSNLTNHILRTILISVGLGVLTLLALIIIWTWYISRTILLPLREVYRATEEVREGNLDYPLPYKKKDEIGRFISGFHAMRLHLKQLKEEQKQYEESRTQLIANISHDLRTPLSSIKGYVEGLEDGVANTEEKRNKYYQVIRSKTNQLDRLIEDLFQLSRIELQKLPLHPELIDSEAFFQHVSEELKIEMEEKRVGFSAPDHFPSVTLSIDPERVVQVTTNLIDNAVTYGAEHVEMKAQLSGSDTFQLSIIDDGPGLEEDEFEKIFHQFYRGEKSRSQEHGGSGLGLAISKSIIEQHNGRLTVQSKVNQGSTFTIELPIVAENP